MYVAFPRDFSEVCNIDQNVFSVVGLDGGQMGVNNSVGFIIMLVYV